MLGQCVWLLSGATLATRLATSQLLAGCMASRTFQLDCVMRGGRASAGDTGTAAMAAKRDMQESSSTEDVDHKHTARARILRHLCSMQALSLETR